ncbi:MAG TPA: CHAT domain-containing protein [Pyrinomonadaceae bacterium]|nr:CHAT domain-containing protein [Pyrinomonadaceae bacterium]
MLACVFTQLFVLAEAAPRQLPTESTVAATSGNNYEAGAKSFAEAEGLRATWEQQALRQSIEMYEKAASQWSSVAPDKTVAALRSAGDIYFMLSEYSSALEEYENALRVSRALIEKLELFNSIAYVYIFQGENEKALRLQRDVTRGLERLPASVDQARKTNLHAQAINNLGEIQYGLGELKTSIKYFDDAIKLWTAVNNRRGIALAHINFGYSYSDSGDLREASNHYTQSLAISRDIGDLRGEAAARAALGGVYVSLGARQRALDSRMEALTIFRKIGNHQGIATATNGIAEIHEELGDYSKALALFREALGIYEFIKSRGYVALNKYCIGRVYFAMKQTGPAREAYLEALSIIREVGDKQIEAHILKALGNLERSDGNSQAALEQFRKVMVVYKKIGDRRNQAYALNSIGQIYDSMDQPKKALACFSQALKEIRATKDGRAEVETLYNLARVEKNQGNLKRALSFIKEGVGIVEASRSMIDSNDLRTAYLAREHKHYELLVDLLMQLRKQERVEGYVAAAFLASEHARARSLLDIRTSDEGNPDGNGLMQRRFELSRVLDAKAEYQSRLLSAKHTPAQVEAVSEDIRRLSAEYETIQSEISQQNPRYEAITQRRYTDLAQIQGQLNHDTLLLEFMLGEERSYVWAVAQTSVEGFELPARAILEQDATELYGMLVARQMAYEKRTPETPVDVAAADEQSAIKAKALSETLLGPVAAQLGSKRLLLITDGALQYIPFEALPLPRRILLQQEQANGDTTPLLIDHNEVVMLPSASLLVAINQEAKREVSTRMIAIFADPVFDNTDPRVKQAKDPSIPNTKENELFKKVSRTLGGGNGSIPRLPGSLREAKAIMDLAPSGAATMATGFDANRERVMTEEFRHYRILHFATHGIIDSETPEASGLVLSMLDKSGNAQNGYLGLSDIYDLDVRADMVVLSACRTYLGQSVQGEGLIGLSRGFMCAGSKSVVASLWKVDDEATAHLMSAFYKAMWSDGLPPSAALRRAKLNMRENQQWRAPYYWAAFVFQGSYNEALTAPDNTTEYTTILIGGVILALALLLLWRGKKMLSRC